MGSGASLAAGDGEINKLYTHDQPANSSRLCVVQSRIWMLIDDTGKAVMHDLAARKMSFVNGVMTDWSCCCVADDKVYILGNAGLQVLDPATGKAQTVHNNPYPGNYEFMGFLDMIFVDRGLYMLAKVHDERHVQLCRYDVDLGKVEEASKAIRGYSCMCAAADKLFLFSMDTVYVSVKGKDLAKLVDIPGELRTPRAFVSTCVVDGVIYTAPATASTMLSCDTTKGTVSTIILGDGVHHGGRSANFSSICAADGKVYLAPAYAARMVVYDTKKRTVCAVDVSSAGIETGKPKFSAICAAGGKVFLAPDHAEKMFVYDPAVQAGMGVELPESCSGRKYGDICSLGGKVYLAPHGTRSVLECTDHQAFSKSSSAKAILAEYEAEKAKLEELWAERIRPAREALKKESEGAGISLHFVIDKFPELSKVKAFPADDPKTFRNLKPSLFAEGSGYGSDLLCPRDHQKGCSLVDAMYEVDEANRGQATHFVSWCWGYTVEQVCSSLKSWRAAAGKPKTKSPPYLWMCFFCNNQYRIKKGQTKPEELKEAFESNLMSIGKMLIILDNCVTPKYTQRMWCVFETFVSVQQKIQPEVILPESATESLAEVMQKESNPMKVMQRMKKYLNDIKVENATAGEKADEHAIKKLIEGSIGYQEVNATVRKRLLPHMSKVITKYFEAFMQADDDDEDAGLEASEVDDASP
ncbi:unnamed protein product [Symbiodinium sp. CCMP2592]|nr:unnamed protein product [Symbiodinium sp. CCMP2592]